MSGNGNGSKHGGIIGAMKKTLVFRVCEGIIQTGITTNYYKESLLSTQYFMKSKAVFCFSWLI